MFTNVIIVILISKPHLVLAANIPSVGTLITTGDVTDIYAIAKGGRRYSQEKDLIETLLPAAAGDIDHFVFHVLYLSCNAESRQRCD